jgi:hypothetical protein
MSNLTKSVEVAVTNQNNLVANNNVMAANEDNYAMNNLQENNIIKINRNIPVDINSEVPHHERWNSHDEPAPPPVPNGGLFGGPQAVGEYASIHVTPTTTNMINNNLRSANPPPGAIHQYPGTNRDRNNYMAKPGVCWYNDTHPVNKGPFSIKVIDNTQE